MAAFPLQLVIMQIYLTWCTLYVLCGSPSLTEQPYYKKSMARDNKKTFVNTMKWKCTMSEVLRVTTYRVFVTPLSFSGILHWEINVEYSSCRGYKMYCQTNYSNNWRGLIIYFVLFAFLCHFFFSFVKLYCHNIVVCYVYIIYLY